MALKSSKIHCFPESRVNYAFHGYGIYFYANGEKYLGEFKNDYFDGEGTFFNLDGSIDIGIWKEDKLIERK